MWILVALAWYPDPKPAPAEGQRLELNNGDRSYVFERNADGYWSAGSTGSTDTPEGD